MLLTNNSAEIKGVSQSGLTVDEKEMINVIMQEIYKLDIINVNTVERLLLEFFNDKDVTDWLCKIINVIFGVELSVI